MPKSKKSDSLILVKVQKNKKIIFPIIKLILNLSVQLEKIEDTTWFVWREIGNRFSLLFKEFSQA